MPKLSRTAEQILAAAHAINPETRYEEKGYRASTGWIPGTNEALRSALGASCGETPYLCGGDRCDIVIPSEAGPIWLEVKHAWTWMTYTKPSGANRSYKKHLLGDGQSALHDARTKLPSLVGQPGVAAVGLLVIGLDSDALPFPLGDLDTLAQLAGMDQEPWERFDTPRRKSSQVGYSTIGIHCHLWMRSAKVASAMAK